MKFFIVAALIILLGSFVCTDAASEPVCSFMNSQGETIFLKYLPLLKKGQDYVDFGSNGKCIKRVTCSDTYKTEIEPCSKYPVTCANKNTFQGVFPGCCVKC